MTETDDLLIPLSALQHWVFCRRQAALIHVERQWRENAATAEGRLLHRRVDRGLQGPDDARSLALYCRRLGLIGRADVVEFGSRGPVPVEYKRGRSKSHNADRVQLCAQALCLEEMYAAPIARGFLYYGATRRRETVPFDAELRQETETAIAAFRSVLIAGHTPPPEPGKKCRQCSLADACQPRLAEAGSVATYLAAHLDDAERRED